MPRGRPKLDPETKRSIRIVARITPGEKNKLDALCEELGCSQSNFVRSLMTASLRLREPVGSDNAEAK